MNESLFNMVNIVNLLKKEVLIRGVDEEIYRRAKATAALLGVPMGAAVGALAHNRF